MKTIDKVPAKVKFVWLPLGPRELIAIFIETSFNGSKDYLLSYQHIGQHGPCHKSLLKSEPANKDEFQDLAKELESIGYNLEILN